MSTVRGSLEFDFEFLPFKLELRDGVLFHQVYDGFDVFQIHSLLLLIIEDSAD